MRIVQTLDEVQTVLRRDARGASELGPILLDRYLDDAIEVDVDVVADGADVFVAGIMEHIEEAGHPFRRQRLLAAALLAVAAHPGRDRRRWPWRWPGRSR